jgi:hypothetical protein
VLIPGGEDIEAGEKTSEGEEDASFSLRLLLSSFPLRLAKEAERVEEREEREREEELWSLSGEEEERR